MHEEFLSVFLTGLVVASVLAVGGAGTAVAGNAGNTAGNDAGAWTQFGYDGQNTGFNPYSTAPTTDLVERWDVATGANEADSPVVSNGTVYFTDSNNTVYAVNETTGETVWEYSRPGTVYGTPVVSNGTVYFGWDYFDDNTPNKIFAVNATTGEQVWRFDFDGAPTSPTVADDTVYFAAELGTMFAVNATTGTEVWNYTADAGFQSDVAVGDETVYAGGDDWTIYGVNRTSGEETFNLVLYNSDSSSVTIWNGSLYYGTSTDGVEASSIDGGSSWEVSTNNSVPTSVAIWNGTVYAATAGGNVLALDAIDGTVHWNRTLSEGNSVSTPAVADGVVYVSADSDVYAVNATSGETVWNRTVGNQVNTPVVADGVVYAGDADGTVTALTEYSNLKPPNFRLSNVTTNGPITAGETLDVTVTAENLGGRSGTQTVELVANGTVRDSASVSLTEWSSDRLTLSWTNTSAGDHTVVVRTANDTTDRTVTIGESSTDGDGSGDSGDGDDGGGGGGGSSVPPPAVRVDVVAEGDDYRRVKVTSARAADPASVSLSGLDTERVSFTDLKITPKSTDAEPRFFVNASTVGSLGVPAPEDGETLGNLSVESTFISNAELASVAVEFRVPADAADRDGVTLYRRTNGGWKPLSTELVAERDGEYVFRAEATGVSLFAVGATDSEDLESDAGNATQVATSGTTEATPTTTEAADSTTATTTTESSGSAGHPAASVLVPLVALLLALGYRTWTE